MIVLDKDKLKFPRGGTQFIHGAYHHIDPISEVLRNNAFFLLWLWVFDNVVSNYMLFGVICCY